MKIKELFDRGMGPLISLEVFPPKANYSLATVFDTLDRLQVLKPDYISVTYGAGGGKQGRTVEIASRIRSQYGVESLAHLTCVGHNKAEMEGILADLQDQGIENILALRGDPPKDDKIFDFKKSDYVYAVDLIHEIRNKGDFGIAAAAYPEGHPECERLIDDLLFLKQKVDAGADFLITQMFFDNRVFYEFVDKAQRLRINVPIVAGIMPILNAGQIKRMVYLSGASIPGKLLKLIDQYEHHPEDMKKAGIEYASHQIQDLLDNHVDGIHLYTMNKWEEILAIAENTGI